MFISKWSISHFWLYILGKYSMHKVARCRLLTSGILAIWKAEIERIAIQGHPSK
jgi:hypothetical protein